MLVLVGAPACGKSSVAAALQTDGFRIRESLDVAEDQLGMPLAQAYVDLGDAVSSAAESAAAICVLSSRTVDVAVLSSGAIRDENVCDALAGHDVVWLKVTVPQLARRLRLSSLSPSVIGSPRAMLIGLLAERDRLYRGVATHIIDTDDRDIAAVSEEVRRVLGAPTQP